MAGKDTLIKIGRQGIQARKKRIPASFFRHRQPGKSFVVLSEDDRLLMHVRAGDLTVIERSYREYRASRETRARRAARNQPQP